MTREQKFKRGNLVEVFRTRMTWSKEEGEKIYPPESLGKAIIEYSYADEHGGDDTNSYSIMWQNTGCSHSWFSDRELKLIDAGGEHLLIEAKKTNERLSKQNKDINFILSKLDEGKLNSESILFLFDMLGYYTSFYRNGEFYVLFSDWGKLHPVFVHIKNASTLEEAKSIFTEAGLEKYNIEKVFNAFHNIV